MSRIVMLLSNPFEPDIRVYKEAQYLVSQGHEVEVLALDAYNQRRDTPHEFMEGIEVTRFYTSPATYKGTPETRPRLRRLLYKIPFLWHFERLIDLQRFSRQVKAHLRMRPCDYLHGHDLSGAWVGAKFASSTTPLTMDLHEEYEEATPLKARFRRVIGAFLTHLENKARAIVYIHEQQVRNISQENREKLVFLPNYPLTTSLPEVEHSNSKTLRLVYVGHISLDVVPLHRTFFEAARGLDISITVHGGGNGFAALQTLAADYDQVTLTGSFDFRTDYRSVYSSADVSYLLYDYAHMSFFWAQPNKFFETLCAGLPYIAYSKADIGRYAVEEEVGFSADFYDVASVRSVLERLAASPQHLARARASISKHEYRALFSWEDTVKNLDTIYPPSA